MPKIRVTCPTCATPLELEAEYAGQEVQCGSCHQVFEAKADRKGRPGDDEDDDRPSKKKSKFRREVDDDEDDLDDRPRRRRRRRTSSGGGTGLGTAALVLGILSIPLACCCGAFSLPISVGGLICGVIGMKNPDARGSALTGAICGGIGAVLAIANVVLGLAFNFGNLGNNFNNRPPQQQQWNPPPPPPPRNFR